MSDVIGKITSIRESLGVGYVVPDQRLVEIYQAALKESAKASEYLTKTRGLSQETISHFKLGYSKEKDAIVIPVYKGDKIVNYKYRYLSGELRYGGESRAEPYIFNEDGVKVGKERGGLLVVEGEFDLMAVWNTGIHNVVSSSSGKEALGKWIYMFDGIKKIFLGLDSDAGGKTTAKELADRLGTDKCYEVIYTDAKDANEFLLKHGADGLKQILKDAKPFIRQSIQSLGDVVGVLRSSPKPFISSEFLPAVKLQDGFMAVVSGVTNIGKTSYALNLANDIAKQNIPVMVMPFERGIESVGARFVQVASGHSEDELRMLTVSEWDTLAEKLSGLPITFALPNKTEVATYLEKGKRYFGTKVVIVDHIDYLVRQVGNSRGDAIMDTLQVLKRKAEELGIVLIIVAHIRKIEQAGGVIAKKRKPNIEDLKGSSALYQDPEVVVMLSEGDDSGKSILVDVVKNKGPMEYAIFNINQETGVCSRTGVYKPSNDSQKELELDIRVVNGRKVFDNGIDF